MRGKKYAEATSILRWLYGFLSIAVLGLVICVSMSFMYPKTMDFPAEDYVRSKLNEILVELQEAKRITNLLKEEYPHVYANNMFALFQIEATIQVGEKRLELVRALFASIEAFKVRPKDKYWLKKENVSASQLNKDIYEVKELMANLIKVSLMNDIMHSDLMAIIEFIENKHEHLSLYVLTGYSFSLSAYLITGLSAITLLLILIISALHIYRISYPDMQEP